MLWQTLLWTTVVDHIAKFMEDLWILYSYRLFLILYKALLDLSIVFLISLRFDRNANIAFVNVFTSFNLNLAVILLFGYYRNIILWGKNSWILLSSVFFTARCINLRSVWLIQHLTCVLFIDKRFVIVVLEWRSLCFSQTIFDSSLWFRIFSHIVDLLIIFLTCLYLHKTRWSSAFLRRCWLLLLWYFEFIWWFEYSTRR